MKKILNKGLAIIMLIMTIISVCSNIVLATEITSANLQDKGDCGQHLQYWHNDKWYYITTTFVTYTENGVEYPAFCLNRELPRSWWRLWRLFSRYYISYR